MKASMPVPAVSLAGRPTVSSGSAMTSCGIIFGWKITFLVCVSALVITDAMDENLLLASRNLKNVLVVEPRYADPLSLIHYKRVIVTKGAMAKIEELWG